MITPKKLKRKAQAEKRERETLRTLAKAAIIAEGKTYSAMDRLDVLLGKLPPFQVQGLRRQAAEQASKPPPQDDEWNKTPAKAET